MDATGYVKTLQLYQRDDNPLFVPETGGSPRFFFFALGHQAIGLSPFGMDFTRIHTVPDTARPKDELLPPWARTGTKEFVEPFAPTYALIGPMAREIARLNFEGKLQAVAEEPGKTDETLQFGSWDATVSYGVWSRTAIRPAIPSPWAASWWPNSKTTSFWWRDSTAALISDPPRRKGTASFCASRRGSTKTAFSNSYAS